MTYRPIESVEVVSRKSLFRFDCLLIEEVKWPDICFSSKNSIQIDLLDVLQENWLQFPIVSADGITPSLYPVGKIDINSLLI